MQDHTKSAAFNRAQIAYDNMTPPEDDGREDFIDEQVSLLLEADDARNVRFFDFAELADEKIAEADDHEFAVVQIILAVRNREFNLASKLADRFESVLIDAATKLVEKELERDE